MIGSGELKTYISEVSAIGFSSGAPLITGVKLANLRIYQTSQRDGKKRGMGTTATSAPPTSPAAPVEADKSAKVMLGIDALEADEPADTVVYRVLPREIAEHSGSHRELRQRQPRAGDLADLTADALDLGLALLQPLGPRQGLAFGAVAVAAGVIGYFQVAALIALILMAAQGSGSAFLDGAHAPPLVAGQPIGFSICRAVLTEDIRL